VALNVSYSGKSSGPNPKELQTEKRKRLITEEKTRSISKVTQLRVYKKDFALRCFVKINVHTNWRFMSLFSSSFLIKEIQVKGKEIPLQPWTGPDGSIKVEAVQEFKTIGT